MGFGVRDSGEGGGGWGFGCGGLGFGVGFGCWEFGDVVLRLAEVLAMRAFGGAGWLAWFCADGFGLRGISKTGDCPELPV